MAISDIQDIKAATARGALSKLVSVHWQRKNGNSTPTLTSTICEHILEKICNGTLDPGAKIVELQVAEELEMSCVPVREAMSKLEQEGWVERIPNRGVFVKKLETKDLRQLYELRKIFEMAAVEKIAETITETQINELKQLSDIVEKAREEKDVTAAREADMHFHRLLIHFTGNERMSLVFESILVQASDAFFKYAEEYPFFINKMRKNLRTVDHRQICEALEKHDSKKAVKLIRSHMQTAYKTVLMIGKFVNSLDEDTDEENDKI